MSLKNLLNPNPKSWLNAKVNSIEIAGDLILDDINQNNLNRYNQSAGIVSGFDPIIDNLDGTVTIPEGICYLRSSNDSVAPLGEYIIPITVVGSLLNNANNWVYVDFLGGTPGIKVVQVMEDVMDNQNDKISLYEIYRTGTNLNISKVFEYVGNGLQRMNNFLFKKFGQTYLSGLILGETGVRNVTMSSGEISIMVNILLLNALDTSGTDTFDRYYGTTSVQTGQILWDNAQYDNSGVLTAITPGQYSFQEFYIESDNDLISVYGQAQYATQSAAETSNRVMDLPTSVLLHATYIGRIIFLQGAPTAVSILNPFQDELSAPTVTNHAGLSGLGAPNDDHQQYTLLNGRLGDILKIDNIEEFSGGGNINLDNNVVISGSNKLDVSEIEHTGNMTIDLINPAADSTLTIENSNGTYKCDAHIEGKLVVNNASFGSPYVFSLQSTAVSTYMEILNNVGVNKGVFFGINGDAFELWNYQGGPIEMYTNPSVSTGTLRMTIENNGPVRIHNLTTGLVESSANGTLSSTLSPTLEGLIIDAQNGQIFIDRATSTDSNKLTFSTGGLTKMTMGMITNDDVLTLDPLGTVGNCVLKLKGNTNGSATTILDRTGSATYTAGIQFSTAGTGIFDIGLLTNDNVLTMSPSSTGSSKVKLKATTAGSGQLFIDRTTPTGSTESMVFFSTANTIKWGIGTQGGGDNLTFDTHASGNNPLWLQHTTGYLFSPRSWSSSTSGAIAYLNSDGRLGTLSSLKKVKTNISPLTDMTFMYSLTPKCYNYREEDTKEVSGYSATKYKIKKDFGLLAEDVESINSDFCQYDYKKTGSCSDHTDMYESCSNCDKTLRGVDYIGLIAPLIKCIQEQKAEIDALKIRCTDLEGYP